MTVWRDGPGFKYLFVVTAILIIVFFLRYQQGSLDTYAYVLAGLGVVILGFFMLKGGMKIASTSTNASNDLSKHTNCHPARFGCDLRPSVATWKKGNGFVFPESGSPARQMARTMTADSEPRKRKSRW